MLLTCRLAAEQDTDACPCETVGNALHAMSYLVIALAETEQLKEAQSVLERASKLTSVPGTDRCYDEANLVFAIYVLKTGDWNLAKKITLEGNTGATISGNLWLAVGIAAATAHAHSRRNKTL
jgi:hypothetical protein